MSYEHTKHLLEHTIEAEKKLLGRHKADLVDLEKEISHFQYAIKHREGVIAELEATLKGL